MIPMPSLSSRIRRRGALSAALVMLSLTLKVPGLFAQRIRPTSLSVTGLPLSMLPTALAVPLTPSVFSPYWVAPASPVTLAPALAAFPLSVSVAPIAAAFAGAPRSEREHRMRELVARTIVHFQTTMGTDTEDFDLVGNTFAHTGPVAPGRRRLPRRFSDALKASSDLNDPAVEVKRFDTMARPSTGVESFQGFFLWEIPSSIMSVLVLTAITAAFRRTRSGSPAADDY